MNQFSARITGQSAVITVLIFCAAASASGSWLYDGSPVYNVGVAIGKDRTSQMVAQPFEFSQPAEIDLIGVAIAGGPDPNHVGFTAMLAEDPWDLSASTLRTWQVYPVAGTTLAFAYFSVEPIFLQADRSYYLVMAPGDSEFMGAVAYAHRGNPALATNDNGQSWFQISPLGVRIGGTVVPEPSGIVALMCGVVGLVGAVRYGRR